MAEGKLIAGISFTFVPSLECCNREVLFMNANRVLYIITDVLFGSCALMMLGIGISQLKSKKPVGFYSGEKPPSEDEISDVQMWNKKHGTMWILFGITIILAWICGSIIGDSVFILIPYLTGLLLPVFIMIWYHHKLIKMYKKK